jgi:hypothetical protein
MTTHRLNSRPLLSKYDNKPTPALFYRPYESIDDIRPTGAPPAMCRDPEIDRWVNEGGAIRQCLAVPRRYSES